MVLTWVRGSILLDLILDLASLSHMKAIFQLILLSSALIYMLTFNVGCNCKLLDASWVIYLINHQGVKPYFLNSARGNNL